MSNTRVVVETVKLPILISRWKCSNNRQVHHRLHILLFMLSGFERRNIKSCSMEDGNILQIEIVTLSNWSVEKIFGHKLLGGSDGDLTDHTHPLNVAALDAINQKATSVDPNKKIVRIQLPRDVNWDFTQKNVSGHETLIALHSDTTATKRKVILMIDLMEVIPAPQAAHSNDMGPPVELKDDDIDWD